MDTRIYIMTHKKCSYPDEKCYYPLQVGAALHESLHYERDDTGDNISEKNDYYCELTGLYWIWKNCNCDNVGICHYRRYYSDDDAERILYQDEYEELLKKYDIIIPRTTYTSMPTYPFFSISHKSPALNISRNYIAENCPSYLESFEWNMNKYFFSGCNMLVTKKALFDKYCEWLFPLLFCVEKELRPDEIKDSYQRRVMGFLSERLMRVWLTMQDARIKEVRMVQTDVPGAKITYGSD